MDYEAAKQVTIEEARRLSKVGTNFPNRHYGEKGHPDAALKTLFRAHYLILWAPNGDIQSPNQYALVQEI